MTSCRTPLQGRPVFGFGRPHGARQTANIPEPASRAKTISPFLNCPYKGNAICFSARNGDAKDVARLYEDPFDHMLIIQGYLAFYPDRVDAIETTARD